MTWFYQGVRTPWFYLHVQNYCLQKDILKIMKIDPKNVNPTAGSLLCKIGRLRESIGLGINVIEYIIHYRIYIRAEIGQLQFDPAIMKSLQQTTARLLKI